MGLQLPDKNKISCCPLGGQYSLKKRGFDLLEGEVRERREELSYSLIRKRFAEDKGDRPKRKLQPGRNLKGLLQ